MRLMAACTLHRVDILDPDGDPVVAGVAQGFHVLQRETARVDLNARFGVRGNLEVLTDHVAEPPELVRQEERRSASAQVNLG